MSYNFNDDDINGVYELDSDNNFCEEDFDENNPFPDYPTCFPG